MKNLIKLAMSVLAATALLTACLITEPKSSDEQSTANNCAVKFSLQNAGGANSNVLFSESEDATPASVALSYRRNGDADNSDIPVTVELTPFGEGYITSDVISLGEGEYVLTRFDVLDAEGYTIYSTPMAGSNITTEVAISTPLAYSFTVAQGEVNTVNMQVIKVDEETDPADFGHVAFTFDVIGYERFFVDVLALFAYPEGWQYTTAEITVKNSAGETIKTDSLDGKMNKVILSSSESYTLTVSKAGYASQTIALSQAQLEQYKEKPLVVRLREGSKPEGVDYVVALDGSGDFTSIQTAIDTAEAGSTIFVKNGEYNEQLVVGKNIDLVGENIEKTIISFKNNTGGYLFYAQTNYLNIKIQNFTFCDGGAGILLWAENDGYAELKNLIIRNNYSEKKWWFVGGIHTANYNGMLENILIYNNEKTDGQGYDPGPGGILISGNKNMCLNHVTIADNISSSRNRCDNAVIYQNTTVTIKNSIIMGNFWKNSASSSICTYINSNITGSNIIFEDKIFYQLADNSAGKGVASDGKDMGFIYPTE